MKRILTIQHTQSEHHVNGMVGSWTDWPLTALGLEQAGRIGERLRAELAGAPAILYSSDLRRARQTAEQIGAALGLAPILRPELRERNLGRCCGKSVAWLRENRECAERTIDDRLFSDAESRRDEWNRLLPFYEELMEGPDACALVVSHGDLLGVFQAMFLGLEPEALNRCDFSGPAVGVSELLIGDDGKHRIRRSGDRSYML